MAGRDEVGDRTTVARRQDEQMGVKVVPHPRRLADEAIARASPGSLLPGRRVRRRAARLRWGGPSRTESPAHWTDRASGAPNEDEPSMPIVASGATARAQATNVS